MPCNIPRRTWTLTFVLFVAASPVAQPFTHVADHTVGVGPVHAVATAVLSDSVLAVSWVRCGEGEARFEQCAIWTSLGVVGGGPFEMGPPREVHRVGRRDYIEGLSALAIGTSLYLTWNERGPWLDGGLPESRTMMGRYRPGASALDAVGSLGSDWLVADGDTVEVVRHTQSDVVRAFGNGQPYTITYEVASDRNGEIGRLGVPFTLHRVTNGPATLHILDASGATGCVLALASNAGTGGPNTLVEYGLGEDGTFMNNDYDHCSPIANPIADGFLLVWDARQPYGGTMQIQHPEPDGDGDAVMIAVLTARQRPTFGPRILNDVTRGSQHLVAVEPLGNHLAAFWTDGHETGGSFREELRYTLLSAETGHPVDGGRSGVVGLRAGEIAFGLSVRVVRDRLFVTLDCEAGLISEFERAPTPCVRVVEFRY